MPSQAGTGFASGFVGALANAFGAKQERGRQDELRARQNYLQLAQFLINSGQVGSVEDLKPLLGHAMPEVFGDKAKKAKGGIDPAQTIGDILNKSLAGSKGQPMLPGPAATQTAAPNAPAPTGDNLQPGGALDTGAPPAAPAALSSRPVTVPGATPAPHMLAGVPLLSPEEASQRKVNQAVAAQQQEIQAKVDLARRILPTLKAVDPKATLDDAMATVGIHLPATHQFTPVAVGRPLAASDVPADAKNEQGQPIDKSTAPYWQPVRGTTGEMFYQPGAQPSAAGGGGLGSRGDYIKTWATDKGLDPNKLTAEQKQTAMQEYAKAASTSGATEEDKKKRGAEIADAIINGDQPPDLSRLYGLSGYVRDTLATKGYNLTQATQDWMATQRYLATLNGPAQTRLRQSVEFVRESIPLVQSLSEDLDKVVDKTKYPLLNKVVMLAAKNGTMGEDAKNAAVNLDNQINELHTELAVMFRGGGASTNEALQRADTLLQSNWDTKQLKTALDLLQKNATIRLNSISSIGPSGTSPGNVYAPEGSTTPSPGAKPATGGKTAPAASGITMDKDGNIYVNGVKQKF